MAINRCNDNYSVFVHEVNPYLFKHEKLEQSLLIVTSEREAQRSTQKSCAKTINLNSILKNLQKVLNDKQSQLSKI